jgi:cobyrinic acid a,c-diamide synthase
MLADCRGWGTGISVLTAGLRSRLSRHNLAGVILSGVADRHHLELLQQAFAEENIPVAGCLFAGDGPGWDSPSPGAWGQPLDPTLLEAVARQVDLAGLVSLAGQRGFLASQGRLTDRGSGGPLIAVAGCRGFTPWSRDSIEVLRSAGAEIRRLDLIEDVSLPEGTAGLVLAGSLWPEALPDIALNTPLLGNIRAQIENGLPTVALGGGMLLLLDRVQDLLGRTSDLAGVIPVSGEILWDLDDASHVELTAERETPLLARGESVTGWVLTDAEVIDPREAWDSPLTVRTPGKDDARAEGVATKSLLCSQVLVHLAGRPGMAARFVRDCAAHDGARLRDRPPG